MQMCCHDSEGCVVMQDCDMFVAVCKNWLSCKSEIYPGLLLKNRILDLLPKYFFLFFSVLWYWWLGKMKAESSVWG